MVVSGPKIVYVLPDEVAPYAKTALLYPYELFFLFILFFTKFLT